MKIKNYTSKVSVINSINRIENRLTSAGATHIAKTYNGDRPTGIVFQINLNNVPIIFKLPVRTQEVYKVLYSRVRKPRKGTKKNIEAQADRTAWKILADWVDIQITMIKLQQAEAAEIFLPYVYDGLTEKTLWKSANTDDANKFSVEIKADITNELKRLLNELKKYVCEVCELNESELNKIFITGISFSWTKDVMGVTVTALKELERSNTPLVINTPHKTEDLYSIIGDENNLIDDRYLPIFYKIIQELKSFIKSESLQLELFPEEAAV